MFTLLLASAAALSGLVSAQNGSYSTSGPLYVDPNSVPIALRQSWCRGQQNNCWMICGGGADANLGDAYPNECDPNDLTWTCTCTNGNEPNITDFADTLPSYICERWIGDCTAAHPNDLEGQTACQSVQCGMRNASSLTSASSGGSGSASASSSMASPTGSSGGGSGSSSGDGSASQSASGAASSSTDNAAVAVGTTYGTGILMGGLLAVFGLAL